MTRKQARDIVFKLTYQTDMQQESADEMLSVFIEHADAEYGAGEWDGGPNAEYARSSLLSIFGGIDGIDGIISALSENWEIGRLSKPTLAALRYGVYELREGEVPASVTINEITDLISKYEGEQAANFVNGVLARYLREYLSDNRD